MTVPLDIRASGCRNRCKPDAPLAAAAFWRQVTRPTGLVRGRNCVDLGVTDKVRPLISAVRAMVRDEIMPIEHEYEAEVGREGDRFKPTARMIEIRELLKAKARAKNLWNFWLTGSDKGYGPDDGRIRLSRRGNGLVAARLRSVQLLGARHRQHGGARALRHGGAEGALAARSARRAFALGLSDDRAGRRLVRRDQYRDGRRGSRATRGRSMGKNGGRPAPAIRAARSTSQWR